MRTIRPEVRDMATKAWAQLLAAPKMSQRDSALLMWDWWPSYMPWVPQDLADACQVLLDEVPAEQFALVQATTGLDMRQQLLDGIKEVSQMSS